MQNTKTQPEEKHKKIFVGGYDSTIQKRILFEYFSKFGEISKIFGQGRNKNRAKGYCFIKYKDISSVTQVLSHKKHILDNRILNCRPVMKGRALKKTMKSLDDRRLFLSNLPKDTNEALFFQMLSGYVEIENFYLLKREGRTTDIAYLTLTCKEDIAKIFPVDIKLGKNKIYI